MSFHLYDYLAEPHTMDMTTDPNSALIWFPVLVRAGLPVPRTEIVPFDNAQMWCEIGESNEPGEPINWPAMRAAAEAVGFPCFVRTDLSSAKHNGPTSYCCESVEDVERVVRDTFYDNCMKDLWPTAILFRQWLDLDATFRAFGYGEEGHPIAREWRIFAAKDGVRCRHFYWPADAIEDHDPTADDWRTRLARLEEIDPETAAELEAMAVAAVAELDGEWSVDFAFDMRGRWWLIDMARARSSWHPEHK